MVKQNLNKLKKKYKKTNPTEKKALEALIKKLDLCNDKMAPEEIQTLIYAKFLLFGDDNLLVD